VASTSSHHPAAQWPPSALKQIDRDIASPTHIALLLPITGQACKRRARRSGRIPAAFYHSGSNATVRIYDSNGGTIASLYERGKADGSAHRAHSIKLMSLISTCPAAPGSGACANYLPAGVKAAADFSNSKAIKGQSARDCPANERRPCTVSQFRVRRRLPSAGPGISRAIRSNGRHGCGSSASSTTRAITEIVAMHW
jgi:hypothetical protein